MTKHKSLAALHEGLLKKEFSSVEITRACLDAIEKDTLNTFITPNENALHKAQEADEKIAKGEASFFTGVPLAVKDTLVTEGLRTTAASHMLDTYIPPYTATAVERLTDKGMVILGKTNCDEYAMGSSNENSAFGPVKNPSDPTRVPGGSSGGSAVAVAAGMAPLALGSDTGGSVRLPGAFCGVVGFKPTYGRISRYGLIAMASSLDQIGILTHDAYDCAATLGAVAGWDRHDATSSREDVADYVAALDKPLPKLKIGIPKEYQIDEAPAAKQLMENALKLYKGIHELEFVEVSLPNLIHSLAVYYIIMPSEVSSNMARYDGLRYGNRERLKGSLEEAYAQNRSGGFGEETSRRIMLGTYALSAGYVDRYYAQSSRVRTLIREDFLSAFQNVDMMLTPTSPTPAFKIGEKSNDPLLMYLSDMYTCAANLAGIPAVSYPAGLDESGLPLGLQLMGPAWSEEKLLRAVNRLMPLHEV